jgi:hypothetical protein
MLKLMVPGRNGPLPWTASSTAGAVRNVRVCAQIDSDAVSSLPHTRKEYDVSAARPRAVAENGPLAPAGQRYPGTGVGLIRSNAPVGQC